MRLRPIAVLVLATLAAAGGPCARASQQPQEMTPVAVPHPREAQETSLLALLDRALCGSAGDRALAVGQIDGISAGESVVNATEYYLVTGTTVEQIKASGIAAAARVFGADTEAASTTVELFWQAPKPADGPLLPGHNLKLELMTVTWLPQWSPGPDTQPVLAQRWSRFVDATQYHEQGHVLIAEFKVAVMRLRLNALPDTTSYDQAVEVCRQVAGDYASLDDAYDTATQHGVLQGAQF